MRLFERSRRATTEYTSTTSTTNITPTARNSGRFGDLPRPFAPIPPKPVLPVAVADVLIASTEVYSGIADLFNPRARAMHQAHRPAAVDSLSPACGAAPPGGEGGNFQRMSAGHMEAINATWCLDAACFGDPQEAA